MERGKRDNLFCITLIMFLVTKIFLTETYWAEWIAPYTSLLSKLIYAGVLLVFCILYADAFWHGDMRYRAATLLIFGCLGISFLVSGRITLLFSAVFVVLSKNTELRKAIRVYFWTTAVCLVLIFAFCALGITEDYTFEWSYGVGHSLGRLHPNGLGLLVLCIILAWEYLNFEKNVIVNIAVALGGALFSYMVPKSRTPALLLIMYVVGLLVYKALKRWKHLNVFWIVQFTAPFFAVLSVILMFFTEEIKSVFHFSNIMVRFISGLQVYKEYGVHLFGKSLPLIGEKDAMEQGVEPLLLDGGYLYLLLALGVLATVIFIAAYTWMMIRAYRCRDYALLILCVIFLFYGLMEQAIFMAQYNFTLLGIMTVAENVRKE